MEFVLSVIDRILNVNARKVKKMKIYFDKSTSSISDYEYMYDWEFGQLRTPLTQYAKGAFPWVLDNGCYSEFHEARFIRMMNDAIEDQNCQWIVVPDVVGNHDRTLTRFNNWVEKHPIVLKKAAFVAQDGASPSLIPWEDIVCLFIGGTDHFKDGIGAYQLALEAKKRGKWVHVGRVNGMTRIINWFGVADSIDGSGISKYKWMRERIVKDLKALHQYHQSTLDDWA